MAGEGTITLIGNATADAELRYSASGVPRATWSLAVTPRVKDGDGWRDGEAAFYRCTAWRQLAETAGESIVRGMRLVVVGRLSPRAYEKDGQQRLSLDVEVDAVGAEMQYATVTARKAERSSGRQERQMAPSDDPWSGQSTEPAPF